MRRLVVAALIGAAAPAAPAQWERVLKQVDLPHHYYYREMYLPQMSGGPDAADWTADGSAVIFSEGGYLWRQSLDGSVAEQLTDSPNYDHQPDVSPDGARLVFVRASAEAMELHVLDLATGAVTQLTSGGAVNVDPRWSPDGSRLAWVSTKDNGRFQLFVGEINDGSLDAQRLRTGRRSRVPRYYYSEFDHELSSTWSPDGTELIFVTNPEIGYGTGGLWRASLSGGGNMKPVRIEETTWKARPDWSPDGRRVIYSSYLGRQRHQLWITTATGGDPFPLTYGEYDVTGARWSPDGQRVVYLSNESGANRLWILDLSQGGARRELVPTKRMYLRPHGALELTLLDSAGRRAPARVSVRDKVGRYFFGDGSWAHAADGFDRGNTGATWRYFHADGNARLEVPAGSYEVLVWRGLEHFVLRENIEVAAGRAAIARLKSTAVRLPRGWSSQWASGDLHVHMNYGGTYRNTPERLARQAAAEELDMVYNLVVNKEQRIPDIEYFSTLPDPASTDRVLVLHGQEFHTSLWGHLGLLGLDDHFLLPDYAAYPDTAAASPAPGNGTVADLTHDQGGLVGYVHPFDALPDPATDESLASSLPVDAALGKVDYYEVVGFSDHLASAEVWHRLLNCGFRIAAGAGTDAMANFASLHGPVGLNRVYARLKGGAGDPAARRAQWLDAMKSGRTFATNGPLLEFVVEGHGPGDAITLAKQGGELRYTGMLRSIVPIRHLQIIVNGVVAKELDTGPDGMHADFSGTLNADGGGWMLLRAFSDENAPELFDLYPYATTGAVWLEQPGAPAGVRCDSGYFLAWLDRVQAIVKNYPDYNTDEERELLLKNISSARAVYEKLAD
ncbi:MAG: CehA/McbA family metallohydrolase [Gammaproteobacteria bacterium]|nr:CehA/McbA family metallohydrolase [Gammaproteobacteria bacterium]